MKLTCGKRDLSFDDVMIGCAPIAGIFQAVGEQVALECAKGAVEAGFNYFDTAPHYGLGLSEERLGKGILQSSSYNIENLRVWTKVGRLVKSSSEIKSEDIIEETNVAGHVENIFPETPVGRVPVLDYSASGVIKSFEQSKARMGINKIYGLRVHDCDEETRFNKFVEPQIGGIYGLLELKKNGEIQEVSAGLNDAAYLLKLIKSCPKGSFDSVLIAGSWNLLDFSAFELLCECEENNISVHNAGIYASGLLVGGDTFRYKKAPAEIVERKDKWERLAEKYKLPLPVVAFSFASLPQCVSKIVVGVKSISELNSTISILKQSSFVPIEIWKEAKDLGLLPDFVPIPSS